MDTLSASKLPRAEVCPASFALPAEHEPGGRYATAGTEIHAQLHAAAHGDESAPAWLRALYAELTEGATQIFAERCYAWSPSSGKGRDLGTHERDYSGLRPGEIGGTVDLVVVRPGEVVVVDYKSGFFGGSVDSTQLSLLALAVRDALRCPDVAVAIVKIDAEQKTHYTKHKVLDALDLAEEATRIRRIVKRVAEAQSLVQLGRTPDVHTSDDGCRYCPCWQSCPAKTKAIATVYGTPAAEIVVTPETAGAVWLAIDAMQAVLDRAKEDVKKLARRGFVPLPDGRILKAVEQTRESMADVDGIEFAVAEIYGEEAAAGVVETKRTITKGALEKLAKSRAEEGKGLADARALLATLRDKGLVKESSFLKFTAVDKEGLPMATNTIVVEGTIGKDATVRSVGGDSVCGFSLSHSNGKTKDGEWRDSTWFEVSYWGKYAEEKAGRLHKGARVTVTGRVSLRKWEKDGKSGASIEIRAIDISEHGASQGSGDRPKSEATPYRKGTDWSNAGPGDAPPDGFGNDDDVPF